MRTSLSITLAVCLGLAAVSVAQPPDRLDHYNLVPSRSVLTQTGGFAGVDNRYRLRGEYDFLQEWSGGTPTEPLQLTARFDNADVRAPLGELLPAFIDVDELLNLEGLRGELLPLGAPFDVYRFQGIIHDGAPASPLESSRIDLFAALIGPWMYLYGETTPPPWSADMFEYEIRALARKGSWADRNGDGVVDAADYTLARDESTLSVTDGDPMADWRSQYGETLLDTASMDAMFAAAMSSAVAVPEPGVVVLALLALTPGLGSRRCGCRL